MATGVGPGGAFIGRLLFDIQYSKALSSECLRQLHDEYNRRLQLADE